MNAVQRAGEVLRLLATQNKPLTVADASRHLKVTPATASRILASLRNCGIVQQDSVTRSYRPGILAFRLARAFELEANPIEDLRDAMDVLVQRTQFTSWIGVLEGTEVVVLKSQSGTYPVQHSVSIGGHLPAWRASLGKALLALKSPEEVKRLYEGKKLGGDENAHSSIQALLTDLELIRKRGYAISDQELFRGVKSASVAFEAVHLGRPIALGISYPIFSLDKNEEKQIIEVLLDEARRYGARTGDPVWGVPSAQQINGAERTKSNRRARVGQA